MMIIIKFIVSLKVHICLGPTSYRFIDNNTDAFTFTFNKKITSQKMFLKMDIERSLV